MELGAQGQSQQMPCAMAAHDLSPGQATSRAEAPGAPPPPVYHRQSVSFSVLPPMVIPKKSRARHVCSCWLHEVKKCPSRPDLPCAATMLLAIASAYRARSLSSLALQLPSALPHGGW